MTPSALPPELRRLAIRTSTAADHGLTRKRLRGADIQHPHHGVSAVDLDPRSVRDLAAAFVPVMEPGQAFSHTTALALHGAPLPSAPPVLHVSVTFPRTPPRRPGIRGHSLRESPTTLQHGMPVAPPVVAWAQSSPFLGRADLVAVGDYLVRDDPERAIELMAIAESWRGRPGAARLQWAAVRVRAGVRSRPETHLRPLLVRSRLPEPLVAPGVEVVGGLTLHPDLGYPAARLALEYEGDGHRHHRVWERDIERRELFAEVGWRTIRVTASQLYHHPRDLVARVRRHLGT